MLPAPAAAAAAAAATSSAACLTSLDTDAVSGRAGGALQYAAPLPLRLKRFCATNSHTTLPGSVLRLLQLAGVQQLQFYIDEAAIPRGLCSAVASLQNVTDLKLQSLQQDDWQREHYEPFPVALAAAVGQLQHLTSLYVSCLSPAGSRLLPPSLQLLGLNMPLKDNVSPNASSAADSAQGDIVSFTHLTALSLLKWTSNQEPVLWDLALPQHQPLELEVEGRLRLIGPHSVSRATVSYDEFGPEVLLDLPNNPTCESVSADLGSVKDVALPRLRDLGDALGALTKVTCLDLWTYGQLARLQEVCVLQQLSKLPALVDLQLTFAPDIVMDDSDDSDMDDNEMDDNEAVNAVSLLEL